MPDFIIAPLLLIELGVLIVICRLLFPIRGFPGVRVFLGLAAITGGVWAAEFLRLSGLIQFDRTVSAATTLLVWVVFPVIGLALVLDLQGSELGVLSFRMKLSGAMLGGTALLVFVSGFIMSGNTALRFLAWAFGSGIFLYSMVRFLLGYRQVLSYYQIIFSILAALMVLSGLAGALGLWGLPWGGIALIFTGLIMIAAGMLFLEQQAILRRLGENQRRQAKTSDENWFLLDPAGRILDFDGNHLRMLKRLHGRVTGLKIHQLLPQIGKALADIETSRRLDMDVEDDFFGTKRLCRFSLFFPIHIRTIFEPRILKIRALPSFDSEHELQGEDAEEQKYGVLRRQMLLMQTALDAFNQGIMITDNEGKVLYRNQILIELLDLSDQALQVDDEEWKERISRRMKDPERLINFISQILNQAVGETLDILECSDGRLLECRTRFYYVDSLGDGFRLWGFLDCTEQQRRERELQHMGMHDTLTGIYNRAFFEMKLRQLRLVSLYPVCMFMVDVDGLKHVNDNQGHPTGDQVLRQAAYVLRQACRTDDIVARLGGDEFGLILIHADREIAEQVAVRIQGLLNIYNIRHPDIPVSISMGYAIADNPRDMETLFSRADDAMYESRRKHRSGHGLMPTP